MPLPAHLTPESLCSDLRGAFDPVGKTCRVETVSEQPSLLPACHRACASKVFADDRGDSCYAFEKLPNNVYRQEYRLNDFCWGKLDNFFSVCVDQKQDGICTAVDAWSSERGSYIGEEQQVVLTDTAQMAYTCRAHATKGACEAAVCDWTRLGRALPMPLGQPEAEFRLACAQAEGDYDEAERECVLPRCTPKQTPFTAQGIGM